MPTVYIVSRVNLNASPFSPVMIQEGIMYYNSPAATTQLRKVDFGAGTDTLFSNALPAEAGNLRSACIANNHYCIGRTAPAPGAIVMVNLATAGVTTRNLAIRNAGDIIAPPLVPSVAGDKVYQSVQNNAAGAYLWESTPPAAPAFGLIHAYGGFANTCIRHEGNRWAKLGVEKLAGFVVGAADPKLFHLDMATGGAAGTGFRLPLTFEGSGVTRGDLSSQRPLWFSGYAGRSGAVDTVPFFLFGFGIKNTTGDLLYFVAQNNDADAAITKPGLIVNGVGGWCMDAVAVIEKFGRIYWGFMGQAVGHGFRLYSSKTTPLDVSNFIDVDTGPSANSITGIWIFPPFVYVAKSSGGTYGAQLVKIYDTELDPRQSGRKGNELWNIIPEIGRYLP